MSVIRSTLFTLSGAAWAFAGGGFVAAQGPPIDGPALGNNRITQAQITSGVLSFSAAGS